MKNSLKKILIFILLVLLIVVIYSLVAPKPKINGSLSTTSNNYDDQLSADTQAILTLLQSVSNIRLDTSIFSRPSYLSLEDQSKQIPVDQNPGRINPFAPIGIDSSFSSSSLILPDISLNTNLQSLNNLSTNSSSGINNTNDSSVIVTMSATNIAKNSAIVWGNILTANQGAERYFEYGLNQSNLSNSTTKVVQSTSGNFSTTLSNLAPGTSYYFVAVVKIGNVVLRGEVQNFTTLP